MHRSYCDFSKFYHNNPYFINEVRVIVYNKVILKKYYN